MSPDPDGRARPTPDGPISITRGSDIEVRGRQLAAELIGKVGFTEMFLLDLDGELPSPQRRRVVDTVLVTLMEHGTTPSSLASRLTLEGAPESLQGAIASGLLAVGSRFLGTIDQVAACLQAVVAAGGPADDAATEEVERLRAAGERVPGVGHNLHAEVDPRPEQLFRVLEEEGFRGAYVEALEAMHGAAEGQLGRPMVLNAAGAVGAALSELGYQPDEVRGFAVVARCAGLFAHIVDERRRPIAREVWQGVHERYNHDDAQGRE
ncbi:MAG: citryl-CoA lyase [Actinobacteria bacterium]|nr:citryl-CoA lyase [Actinomycetota bacterium]